MLRRTRWKASFGQPQGGSDAHADCANAPLSWTVNALAVAALTAYWRDPVGESVGLLLFVPGFVRFLDYQAGTALPTLWVAGLDVRFVQGLAVVGAAWLAARLVRHAQRWPDLPHRSVLTLLAGDALLLVVLGLQFEGPMLTVTWAANALGLTALARWTNRPKLAWAATAALALTAARWLLDDAMSDALTPWLTAARQGFLSGLAVVAAGWIGASLFVGRSPRRLTSLLALTVNLLLLIVIAYQWDGYAVLTLWTIDVAALWLVGFARRHPPARFEALLLWVSVLPAWIMLYGLEWSRPLAEFDMLVNPRFGALAFVGLVGAAATWAYRRRLARRADTESDEPGPRLADPAVGIGHRAAQIEGRLVDCERSAHLVCIVLANLVLVAALTVDVQTLYDRYASLGGAPFRDLTMARQATLSVVWAAYAATLFVVGFACRYAPVRILAMVGLAPILAKVFLVDLRDLDVIYRVLSFAVLGGVFIGVSYLYQRYRPRIGVRS